MSGDLLLAVIGLSAGTGTAVGAWAALWWRDHAPFGEHQLVAMVFAHVDEVLGATKWENTRRANRRHKIIDRPPWWLWWTLLAGKNGRQARISIASFFWPVPQFGTGTAALPTFRRMGYYVQLEFQVEPTRNRYWLLGRFGPLLYQRWNIQAVQLRWTSEAAANRDTFVEYLERGRPSQGGGLAQALGLEWKSGMFEVTKDYPLSLIRFARKGPAKEMPTRPPHAVGATR
jgi:hypothetical protein